MKNKLMFSTLDKYMDEEFFYSHLDLTIFTPMRNYKGKIFSAYSIGIKEENNNIKSLDFEERIQYYQNASKFKVSNESKMEKIVKLSTCSYLNSKKRPTDQRYYIIANLEVLN